MADGLSTLSNCPGWLIDELNKIVTSEQTHEAYLARRRQRAIAAELGQNRKSIEGLGRPRLEVDSAAYHYWGTRLGYQCWKDKQFLREFERDNEDARVKSTGTKLQVGYGSLASAASHRTVKTYG